LLNSAASQPNGLATESATHPVNGGPVSPSQNDPTASATPSFFHDPQNSAAITNNGLADCEQGQRGYINGSLAVSNQFGSPGQEHVVVDAHPRLGYRAGPTYAHVNGETGIGLNPDQVPPGETFTREPGGIGAVAP
jgi:hypothetical protein